MLARPSVLRTLLTRTSLTVDCHTYSSVPILTRYAALPSSGYVRSQLVPGTGLGAIRAFTVPPRQPSHSKAADVLPQGVNSVSGSSKKNDGSQSEPPKQSFFSRFRAIMKQYGWWALAVYMGLSCVDLGLTWATIHFYASDHVDELEALLSKWMGPFAKKIKKEEEPVTSNAVISYMKKWISAEEQKATELEQFIARATTEFVISYAIHKTLLLPVRAGLTAMITPNLVRWLTKRGWIRGTQAAAKTTV